ncbi:MFS transporter TsgA [Salmonella enterica subsp. enterica serovar Typhi]|nr:MFS transporter TsgA [Salmonella enterica subsp. enterica serovar Typhi]
MTNSNRIKLTWISFLSYALTGALVIVTGMVMGNIADYFQLPVSSMSNTFTFLNAGILISIFLNAWLMEIVPLKTQLRFGFILMVLAVAGLMFSHSLALFSAAMFVLGLVSGITMSIGTFLITQLYEGRQRGSRLLFTDSFFSMAGMIFPMVAAFLLARSIEWYWVYACIGLVYLAIFILTFGCEFPALGKHAQHSQAPVVKEKWGIGVLFLAVAAKGLGMSLNDAGALVSDFWMSYMFGMWAFSFILRFFDLQRILTVLAGMAAILMYLFITGTQAHMPWFILTLGFFSSAIYTSIITLGSQQTKVASPKLVNFILTCGTIGTMLTFVVTGPIVAHSGPQAALLTANGLYAVVFVMCFALGFVSRHRQHSSPAAH